MITAKDYFMAILILMGISFSCALNTPKKIAESSDGIGDFNASYPFVILYFILGEQKKMLNFRRFVEEFFFGGEKRNRSRFLRPNMFCFDVHYNI